MLLLFLCCVVVWWCRSQMGWRWTGNGTRKEKNIKRKCLSFIIIYFAQILQKEKHTNSYFFVLKIFETNKKNMINVRNINICIRIYKKSRSHIHKQISVPQDEAGERQTSINWLIFLCFTGRLNHFSTIMFVVSSIHSRWETKEMC